MRKNEAHSVHAKMGSCKNCYEKRIGAQFEIWVKGLFQSQLQPNVRRNIRYAVRRVSGSIKGRAQIDVEYGLLIKTRIECKYSRNGLIREDFAEEYIKKFACAKQLLGPGNYILATNADFSQKTASFARQCGIQLCNGVVLQSMYDSTLKCRMKKLLGIKPDLEQMIQSTKVTPEQHYEIKYVLW